MRSKSTGWNRIADSLNHATTRLALCLASPAAAKASTSLVRPIESLRKDT